MKTNRLMFIRLLMIFFIVCLLSVFSFLFTNKKNKAQASAASYSLATAKTAAVNGETIPVTINMDTAGNDVVVARVVMRYNKNLVSLNVADIDLSSSAFTINNSCVFPNDYSDASLQNKPCQIISNDTDYGILQLTLMMPSHSATTNPGVQINSSNVLVAIINFKAKADISTGTSQDLLKSIGGIYYATNRTYGFDSNIIIDDGNGTDILGSAPTLRSTASNGDLNSDRKVDGADFSILHNNYNSTAPGNAADIDGDGNVNGADFSLLHTNYNQTF